MYDMIACPQCGEPTEVFADGVCSDCSLSNQMELDEFLEASDRWNRYTEAQKDRAINQRIALAEHFTERDGEDEDGRDSDDSELD